ncbi:UNVERIFIED_CONTAM: hypothetical protein Sindi_1737200 [Sesamum indicum]
MGRDSEVSRSPSYRRRHSPSPVPVRNRRRSRRDRSRSPYSYSRRRSRSLSSRHRRSRSPILRHHGSCSPTSKRNKRQRKRSTSSSPSSASPYVSADTKETKDASDKLRKEEEEKKRRQQEAELKLIEEETARRVAEAIRKKVQEGLNSEETKLEIDKRLREGRKKVVAEVAAQLEKEKEAALIEAMWKEASKAQLIHYDFSSNCANSLSENFPAGADGFTLKHTSRLTVYPHYLAVPIAHRPVPTEPKQLCSLAFIYDEHYLTQRVVQEQAQRGKEELERRLEENRWKLNEAQREEALEQERQEEERYRELEELQRQKEETLRRKKQQEEEERANQMKLLGKNKSRPKLSFSLGSRPIPAKYQVSACGIYLYQTLVATRHVAGSGLRLILTIYVAVLEVALLEMKILLLMVVETRERWVVDRLKHQLVVYGKAVESDRVKYIHDASGVLCIRYMDI